MDVSLVLGAVTKTMTASLSQGWRRSCADVTASLPLINLALTPVELGAER
jgi:hypothetical protein